jgi:hypothetical protein
MSAGISVKVVLSLAKLAVGSAVDVGCNVGVSVGIAVGVGLSVGVLVGAEVSVGIEEAVGLGKAAASVAARFGVKVGGSGVGSIGSRVAVHAKMANPKVEIIIPIRRTIVPQFDSRGNLTISFQIENLLLVYSQQTTVPYIL